MNLKEFLNCLHEDKPSEAWVLIWTLRDKKSAWFKDLNTAAEYEKNNNKDVFVGVGLSPDPKEVGDLAKPIHRRRCLNSQIIGISGLWADIDIKNPVHKKENLPRTVDEALSLVEGHGFDPTIIVLSGHGIHAYWLFKEPLIFDSDDERDQAQTLSFRINATIKQKAAENNWDVDSVHDLSRIMRIPGTWNCKTKDHVLAKVIKDNKIRYNPEDFEEFIVEDCSAILPVKISNLQIQTVFSDIKFEKNANPPADNIISLKEAFDPKFTASWDNNRPHLKDKSPSGYDYSLTVFANKAGWTMQEIVDLLISHRRKHGHDLKFDNKQYYVRTILKAREEEKQKASENNLEALVLSISTEFENGDYYEQLRQKISEYLGINIIQVFKYLVEPDPIYYLIVEENKIRLGTVDNLIVESKFRKHVAKGLGYYLPKQTKWWVVAQGLLDLCVEAEVGPEVLELGQIESWVREYIEGSFPITIEESLTRRGAFVKDGKWNIHLPSFYSWLRIGHACELNKNTVAILLKRLGCEYKDHNVYVDKNTRRRTKRGAWIIPDQFIPEKNADLKLLNSGLSDKEN